MKKNLSKVLTLVLAFVMVLGLMTVGASAAFTDDADITYIGAVEVLNGLGVINGIPGANGSFSFDPKGNFDRGGLAKMVAYFCWGGADNSSKYANSKVFNDLAGYEWAAGSINYGFNAGYINGVDSKTYDPDGVVTGSMLAKTLLCVLGYKADAKDPAYALTGANWELNSIRIADDEGLFDNLVAGFDPTKPLTREEAAMIFANALTLDVYTSYNDDKTPDGIATTEVLAKYFPDWYGFGTGDAVDSFGRPLNTMTNGVKTINLTINPVAVYTNNFDTAAQAALAKKGYTGLNTATISYNACTDTWGTLSDLTVPVTGAAVNGYNVELYDTNEDKAIDKIVVIEGYFATVGAFTPAKGNTPASVKVKVFEQGAHTSGTEITVVDDDTKTTDMYNTLAAYATGSAIEVVCKTGWHLNLGNGAAYILSVADVSPVAGKITKVNVGSYNCTTSVVINGTTYPLNNQCVGGKALTAGLEGTLYLDAQGKGLAFVANVPVVTDKAIAVTEVFTSLENGKFVNKVTGYLSNGSTTTLTLEPSVNAETIRAAAFTKVYEYADADFNGLYTLAEDTTDNTPANGDTLKYTGKTFDALTKTFEGCYFASDVKFIFVDDTAPGKVTVKTGMQAFTNETIYVTVKTVASVNYITAVYVMEAPTDGTVATDDIIFIASQGDDQSILVNNNATTVFTYNAYVNGVKLDGFYADDDNVLAGFYKSVKVESSGAYDLATAYTNTGNTYKGNGDPTAYVNGIMTVSTTDYDVSSAVIVDLTATQVGLANASSVYFLYNNLNNVVSYVYIVA